jgi:8-oxo-dGTP pyrophosphatase MutT (NUDIX family)
MSRPSIVPIDHLELAFAARRWAFADRRRAEIDAHFAARRRQTPELWNGRVLVLHEAEVAGRTLRGTFSETDFASLMAWRDWGFPTADAVNCFAAAALRTFDGAFLLGVMGSHTANAGQAYFPCGTPDLQDVSGDRVDLDHSVMREVAEETGLLAQDGTAAAGWQAVVSARCIALVKRLQLSERAEVMRARILGHLATESQPELVDIRIVRGPADVAACMPEYVTAFLAHAWAAEADA